MTLFTSDYARSVSIGLGSVWLSIYSTAKLALPNEIHQSSPQAMAFLKTGECKPENVKEVGKQLKIIHGAFRYVEPENAVYDWHKPTQAPPWADNIAPTVTSCADLFTTADGKDAFSEIFQLLKYAEKNKLGVITE